MSLDTTTHLNFHGEAQDALTFYQSVFGGELTIATYADLGMPKDAPGATNVVFGQVVGDNGFRVMAYDIPDTSTGASTAEPAEAAHTTRKDGLTLTTEKFFLSIRADSIEEVSPLWEKLRDGATIIEPFGPAQWAPAFGMLTDRFGITWILDVKSAY